MNPFTWDRRHLAAWLAFCVAGALCGLGFAWLESPFRAICSGAISGEWANCSQIFLMWLQYPSAYWPMMLYGALVTGVTYYGVQLARRWVAARHAATSGKPYAATAISRMIAA
jgi:hypothetical protein